MVTVKEYNDIIATIGHYTEGHHEGSSMMKKAFHPNAIINGEPIQVLFDAIDNSEKLYPDARVDILSVIGGIACARVILENCGGKNYIDFLQLMKTDGAWKIISKIYHEY